MVTIQDEEFNKKKVFKVIKNTEPYIFTIDEISKITKLSRQTVSKYIHILYAEGKVKIFKKVGKIKLYQAI